MSNLSDMEKEQYAKSVLELEDVQEALECVRENSLREGILQGIERGIEQGVEQGIEQGRKEERRQLVKGLLSNGFDVDVVAKVTGLDEVEVRSLIKEV